MTKIAAPLGPVSATLEAQLYCIDAIHMCIVRMLKYMRDQNK